MRAWRRYSDAQVEHLPVLLANAQAAGLYRVIRHEVPSIHWDDEVKELTGPSRALAAELWTYAFPVLKNLLRDGLAIPRVRQLGVPVPTLTNEQSEAIIATDYHRDDLAGAMVEHVLPRFLERVVTKNSWDPTRSTLTTYFVNACLLTYPDVLRKWIKDRSELTAALDEAGVRVVQFDTELAIQDREMVRSVVLGAPEGVRSILAWLWLGYSIAEIAEKIQLNPSTIRSRLFEFRKKKLLPLIRTGRLLPPAGYALQAPSLLGGQ